MYVYQNQQFGLIAAAFHLFFSIPPLAILFNTGKVELHFFYYSMWKEL